MLTKDVNEHLRVLHACIIYISMYVHMYYCHMYLHPHAKQYGEYITFSLKMKITIVSVKYWLLTRNMLDLF